MSTPHIAAEKGEIAERILLPGDPLRAKFIAENFLDNPKQYTSVRNILGFTGTYKGVPVSVQGTGMGIPSISIYVHELIHEFGCKKLFRVGTCGAMHPDVHLRDVLIAQAASTDSSIIRNIFGGSINYCPIADYDLLSKAVANTKKLNLKATVGNIISVDRRRDGSGCALHARSRGTRSGTRTLHGQRSPADGRGLHDGGTPDILQRHDQDCTRDGHRRLTTDKMAIKKHGPDWSVFFIAHMLVILY